MRFFNTAGPVRPDDHYCIPPLERFDLDEVLALVRMKKYFVLHAPRQTGKTSALLALRDLLNGQGYACVYTTVEEARTARDDAERVMRTVLSGLGSDARSALGDDFLATEWSRILVEFGPNMALREALKRWAEASAKPLVTWTRTAGWTWISCWVRSRTSSVGTRSTGRTDSCTSAHSGEADHPFRSSRSPVGAKRRGAVIMPCSARHGSRRSSVFAWSHP